MNNDKKIQSSAKEKSLVKRCLALLTCVGMLGSFMMPYQGVLPVIAEDGEEQEFYENKSQGTEERVPELYVSSPALFATLAKDGSNPWFDSIQTSLPVSDAVEIKSSNITGLTIKDAGTSANAGDSASLALSLVMSYKFSTAEKNAIIDNGGYIYFNIDTNPEHSGSVRLTQGYSGETCFSDDATYSTATGNGHCGYYSISQAGLLVLKFTPEYLNYLSGQSGDFTGKIGFDATVDRAEDATGDRTINIGGKTIDVAFNDEEATVSKSGQQIQENGKKYIKWNITINNPNGHVNLKGYKLQDILSSTLKNTTKETDIGTSDMRWDDDVTFWDGQNNVTFGHWEDGYFVFDKDGGYPSQLTFTYNQEVTSGESATNTVNLIPTEGETKTDSATKSIENKLEISKEGKPDYEVDGTTNKEIEWTITLNNAAADSLNGVEVTDDKFPSSVSDIIVYSDLWNKYTVPSANYSITSEGKLLFENTDSYTVPSKLYIVYRTSADVDTPQSNTASAHSTVTTNPPDDATIPNDKIPSVTYKDETKIVKRGDGYVPNEGKVKWKITLLSAYDREWDDNGKTKYASDTNNKQTLNEYTLTDTAFANLNASDFSYNACYLDGNGGEYNTVSNNANIVEIVKGETDSNTIIIKVKDESKGINKLELFYRTPIDTTTAEFKASTENSKISTSNEATYHGTGGAGFTGTGTASEYYYNRESVSKSCVAGGEEVTTFDELDDREMTWKVTLTKDSGFSDTDLVFTDVLSATNGGQHYITPEQVLNTENDENAGIRLYNVTAGTATQLTLNTDYTITFKTTDGALMTYADFVGQTGDAKKNASEFAIKFTSAVNTAGVHVVDLYYNTTAKTDTVTLTETAEYSNTSTFGSKSATETGLKFTHEDPNNAEKNKVTLNISKSWNDGNDAMNLRPSQSQFKLMRALVGSDTWETLKNDDTWGELAESSTDYKTFTVLNNNNNWLQLGDSFPKWYVDTSNSNKVTYYRYKVVEVNVDKNYTPQYMNAGEGNEGEWNAKDGTGTFTVTNNPNFRTYSKKAILDTSGQEVTTYYTADLPKVTINNQKYYLFGWELSFLKDDKVVFEDTIPAGSFLIDSTYSNLAEYQPKGKHNWENVWTFYDYALSYEVEKKETGDVIRFTKKDGTFDKIRYFIAVPVNNVSDSLDGNGNIVNQFKKRSDEEGVIVSVPVIENEQNNYLEKKASSNSAGLVTYDLYINEDGANLSNGDTLEITDYLTIGQKADEDLKFKLTAFHVYPYNAETKKDLSPELGATEVSYRDRYNVTESNEVEVQEDFTVSGNSFIKYNLTAGETLKITIKGTPNYSFKDIRKWENDNYNNPPNLEATLDENGYYTFDYTVPEGVTKFTIDRWNGTDNINDVQSVFATKTETVSTTYPAKLVMTVPDEQCLHIRYVYQVIGYVPNQSDILLNNKASFESENGSGYDEANNTKLYVTKSTAENSIETYPKIYKVDVNNFGLNTLEATFKVAKWDGKKWVYASSIQTLTNYEKPSDGDSIPADAKTDSDNFVENALTSRREFVFGDAGLVESNGSFPSTAANFTLSNTPNAGTEQITFIRKNYDSNNEHISNTYSVLPERITEHNFNLETGIYKFVETVPPTNYQTIPNDTLLSSHEEFTFYYAYGNVDTSSLPKDIQAKVETILEGNSIEITNSKNISISAKKTFSGLTSSLPSSSTVTLELLSSTERSIESAEPVEGIEPKVISYPNEDTVTWNNLATGTDREPIYYFVREVSYKIGDVTYTRDPATGKYRSESGDGIFTPVYTFNGTNVDGTVVEINNSQGMIVKKVWLDSSGREISAPLENGSSMSVPFEVYGVDDNNVSHKLDLDVTQLTGSTNPPYEYLIPQEKLGSYNDYYVTEKLTPEQKALLPNYTFTTNKKIDKKTRIGVLEMVNTNQDIVYTTDASVRKIWSGGAEGTHSDVPVKLIQTTSPLSSTQLANADADGYDAIANGQQAIAVNLSDNGSGTSTYIIDSDKNLKSQNPFVVEPSGFVTVTNSGKTLTVTGTNSGTGTITVTFEDDSTQIINIAVFSQTATLTSESLSATWHGLPLKDSNGVQYYYYALETEHFDNYLATYSASNQQTIITNTSILFDLKITKLWADAEDVIHDDDDTIKIRLSRDTVKKVTDVPLISDEPELDESVLSLSVSPNEIETAETATLTAVLSDESSVSGVTYEVYSDEQCTTESSLVTITDNIVTAGNDTGTVYIRAKLGNKYSEPVELVVKAKEDPDVITLTAADYYYFPVDSTKKIVGVKFDVDNSNGQNVAQPCWYPFDSSYNAMYDSPWHDGWITAGNQATIESPESGEVAVNYTGVSYIGFKAFKSDEYVTEDTVKIKNIVVTYEDTSSGGNEPVETTSVVINGPTFSNSIYSIASYIPNGAKLYTIKVTVSSTSGNINCYFAYNVDDYGNSPKASESPSIYNQQLSTHEFELDVSQIDETPRNVKFVAYESNEVSKIELCYSVSSSNTPFPHRPTRSLPSVPTVSESDTDTFTPRRVARLGTVKALQEIIKEDDTIDTISEAIAVLPVQKITKKSILTRSVDTWPKEIELTYDATNGWTTTESFPMYDESGQKYYYWVEEIEVNGESVSDNYGGGYAVSYQFVDGTSETTYCIDAVKHGDGEITIKNTPQTPPPDDDSVTLPTSGGSGTAPYRNAGFLLMMTAVTFPYIKHRNRRKRNSA